MTDLSNYTTLANGQNGSNTSEIDTNVFIQSTWDDAHGGTLRGDISFGSADEPGPTTSFADEGADFECFDCEEPFPTLDTPFNLAGPTDVLRIGWGEGGGQAEGWFPWWDGMVFIR